MVSKTAVTYSAADVQAAHRRFAILEVYERQSPGRHEVFVVHNIPGVLRNIFMSALRHEDEITRVPIEYVGSITNGIW